MTDVEVVRNLQSIFKNDDGQPIKYAERQNEIISCLATKQSNGKKINHMSVVTPSQWGKSTAAAIGMIIRAMLMPESWKIIGGTQAKAGIIMGYVLNHIFDNDIITSQLEITGGMLQKLKRERRHDKITFKRGGSIEMLSAENRNRKRIGEILLGKSGRNVVIDDSALFPDDLYTHVMRMVGGQGEEGFIAELSNPFRRNHFFKTMHDKTTHKIWIDYHEALAEGRFSQGFIDQMKKLPFFDVFYECKFPTSDAIDEQGYMQLFPDELVDGACGPVDIDTKSEGVRLGVDVATGGNNTVFALRDDRQLKIDKAIKTGGPKWIDTVQGIIIQYMREGILAPFVFIDGTGVGSGLSSSMISNHYAINNIVWGGSASEESISDAEANNLPKFSNQRAECYYKFREWLKRDNKIDYNENLVTQLKGIKYRLNAHGDIQIQPKAEMIITGCDSPDEADAAAETFAENNYFKVTHEMITASAPRADDEDFVGAGIDADALNSFTMRRYGK
jgi:hypothetical protein